MPSRIKYVLKLMGVIESTVTRSPVPGIEAEEQGRIRAEFEKLCLRSPLN